ncbi:MAG: DUF5671 domain-containing protein [Candidatus Adlerbacteria bacterium]
MDNKTTPKDFFMWAGAMVALYGSVIAFIGLVFDYINYALPNPLAYYSVDPYQGGISYEMAVLIVLFPLAVILMRVIHADITKDRTRANIWVRRWALFLTLFVAGATIAVDLIVLLTSFLNGSDITAAFLLKVLVVFLVAGGSFLHFIADFKGYWDTYPGRSHAVGYSTGALVLLTIVAGFFIVGTPAHARLLRLDQQKITDMQQLQSEVMNFYQQKRALPTTLAALNDPLLYNTVPLDPQSGLSYEYTKNADLGFELCATFNLAGEQSGGARTMPVVVGGKPQQDNWSHAAGRQCFVRSIDPDLFPPLK